MDELPVHVTVDTKPAAGQLAELRGQAGGEPAPALAALYSALDSAHTRIALDGRDWGSCDTDAWLYGIFVGWDDDPSGGDVDQNGSVLDAIATRFGWSAETVARLRMLRAGVKALDLNLLGDLLRWQERCQQ